MSIAFGRNIDNLECIFRGRRHHDSCAIIAENEYTLEVGHGDLGQIPVLDEDVLCIRIVAIVYSILEAAVALYVGIGGLVADDRSSAGLMDGVFVPLFLDCDIEKLNVLVVIGDSEIRQCGLDIFRLINMELLCRIGKLEDIRRRGNGQQIDRFIFRYIG